MDKRLLGKTILIGREEKQSMLVVSVSGVSKVATLGAIGSVPGSVSRWKNGTAHCQIAIGLDGGMIIKNLKDPNVTYVNGAAIVSKRIDGNSQVELGKDHYTVNIEMVLQAAFKLLPVTPPPPPPVKEYSIKHLERVWDDYHEKTIIIAKRRSTTGLITRVPFIFTMGSGLLAGIAAKQEWGAGIEIITIGMSILGALLFLYGLWKSYTDKSIEESEDIKVYFEQQYVCPNPDCQHFLGYKRYTLLTQDKACPYCKCKYKS